METHDKFLSRLGKFEKKDFSLPREYFQIHQSVRLKVDQNNQFKEFYGDTTVFNLLHEDKKKVDSLITKLYEVCPECFSTRLCYQTLHMTLHDLSNSADSTNIPMDLNKNLSTIQRILRDYVSIKPFTIKMRTNFITNILNISLVLALIPADEEEYRKLMILYNIIDCIKVLDYPLTPHITLGYYNINGFNADSAEKLENLVRKLNEDSFEITLRTDMLFYQRFTNMNQYSDVYNIGVNCWA